MTGAMSHEPTGDVPLPDRDQQEGYLVVLRPELVPAEWQAELAARGTHVASAPYFSALRAALPTVEASRYRGISRYPVDRWWEKESPSEEKNSLARLRLWEWYGPDPTLSWQTDSPFDADLISSMPEAEEICGLTDEPLRYEVVRVTRGTATTSAATAGFDIGHWGGKHFSILCDAMMMVRWHPCPVEDLHSLEPWSRKLNEHMLFAREVDASEYRRWYLGQPWAEAEGLPNQIQIVRVDLTAP
jgi:hypothetical protein